MKKLVVGIKHTTDKDGKDRYKMLALVPANDKPDFINAAHGWDKPYSKKYPQYAGEEFISAEQFAELANCKLPVEINVPEYAFTVSK